MNRKSHNKTIQEQNEKGKESQKKKMENTMEEK